MKIEDREFRLICEFMRNNYGIDLGKKRSLIEGRLTQTVTSGGFQDFRGYTEAVLAGGNLQQQMVTKLTTNFTFFRREDMHYDYMVQQAVPDLLKRFPSKSNLKIWSAGCSTGDEAYTASMYLKEMPRLSGKSPAYSILATDISDYALRLAREGCYPADSLKNIPPAWKKRYFQQAEDEKWRILPEITDSVHFSKLNLMENFPLNFRYFDIIFCRNVMIYFTSETRRELVRKFYAALNPGGYFFIGMSENIPAAELGFRTVKPSIFKKEG